jgi:hypothetical protein
MRPVAQAFAVSTSCLALALAALACGAGACGASSRDTSSTPGAAAQPDAGPTPEEELAAREAAMGILVERHLAALEQMAAIVDAHRGDCPAMAAALDRFFADQRPLFAEIAAAEDNPYNTPVLERLSAPTRPRARAAEDRAASGIVTCASDPRMVEVIERMPFH